MYNVDITGDDEPIGRWFKPDITSRGRQRLLNNGSGILGSSGERGLFANVGVYYTMCSYMIIYIDDDDDDDDDDYDDYDYLYI